MKKPVVFLLLSVLVLGGLGYYYFTVPKNARQQLEYAKQLEEKFVKAKVDLAPEGVTAFQAKVLEAYQKVESFPEEEVYDEAMKSVGDFYRQIEDTEKALETYLKFEKRFPKSEFLQEIQKNIITLYTEKKQWEKLIEYYENYVKENPNGLQSIEFVFEIAKIKKSYLPNIVPMSKIKAFERVIELEQKELSDPAQRKFTPVCLWEIAVLYESIAQLQESIQFLDRLIQQFPDSEYTTRALIKKGEILSDKLGKKEEAKKQFEELKRNYPESSEAKKAGGRIREIDREIKGEKGEEARTKQEKYLKEHYGGGSEYDISQELVKHLGEKGLSNDALGQIIAQRLDLLHYEGNIKIQPDLNRLDAQLTLTLKNNGETKNDILLLLSPMVSLEKVKIGEEELKTSRADMRLKIVLNKPLEKGADIHLSFQIFIVNKERGKLILQEAGMAMADANWYPSAFLGDIFTAKITYQVPKEWEAIGNGALLTNEYKTIDEKEWHFQTYEIQKPIFGIYFAYGKYKIIEDRWKEIPIYLYYKNENFTKQQEVLDHLKEILTFYEERFHSFPYPKMAVVETPLPAGIGGVGPASLMLIQEEMFAANHVPDSLMAHEAGHQWWGNLVPISFENEGESYSQWLSEGFASYSDAMYLEQKYGKTRFLNHLLKYGSLYFEQCLHTEDISISKNLFHPSYVGVIYMKGACVLHALRWVMGDEKFNLALRKFAETYAFKFSSIHAFKQIADEVYGDNLYWFFKQWLDSPGYPHYFIKNMDVKPEGEKFLHTVQVLQKMEVYKMPILFRLEGETEDERYEETIWIQEEKQQITLIAPFRAKKVILDPDSWIMKYPGDHHIWSESLANNREKIAKGEEGLSEESAVPDFNEKDLEGNWISPKNYAGKVILINFWATWCPPCVEEIPLLVSLQKQYGPKGFQIISICMDENKSDEDLRNFCRETKINFPVVPYIAVSFEKFGAITAIPLSYLVDQEGKIVQQVRGKYELEFWEEALKKLLK